MEWVKCRKEWLIKIQSTRTHGLLNSERKKADLVKENDQRTAKAITGTDLMQYSLKPLA
jgi:hypothetical protein